MTDPLYQKFLGTWILDVASCDYEQGEPPRSASQRIEANGGKLVFNMNWTDENGEAHQMSFRGTPDGTKTPFNGGELADALSVAAESEKELDSSAYRDGVELMIAKRTLSDDGTTLHLLQQVRLPDGTRPTNRSIYYRQQ